jgi:hypothetical protein
VGRGAWGVGRTGYRYRHRSHTGGPDPGAAPAPALAGRRRRDFRSRSYVLPPLVALRDVEAIEKAANKVVGELNTTG